MSMAKGPTADSRPRIAARRNISDIGKPFVGVASG